MSDPVVLLSTGDVVGPAGGVTDNSMVLFSGTSGKLIKGNNAQVTSAGLALLDDIDANAQLTTLGLTTTQPQFDNSVKQATTAFVQRALGSFSGQTNFAADATITSAEAGKVLIIENGCANFTLPLASTLPLGGVISCLVNKSTVGVAFKTQGPDVFDNMLGGGGVTSQSTGMNDFVQFRKSGSGWSIISGGLGLKHNSQFGFSLTSNGYQKLPSGLIIQWFPITPGTTAQITYNYPIVFPNGVLSWSVGAAGSSGANVVRSGAITSSSIQLTSSNTSQSHFITVIGY